MLNAKNIILLAILIVLSACSSLKTNPLEYKGKSIIFGNGGGFAGIEQSTILLESGHIYQLENMRTKYQLKKKLEKREVEQLFSILSTLELDQVELNSPENSYKYIEFCDHGSTNRLAWSSDSAPNEIQILNRILHKLAQ